MCAQLQVSGIQLKENICFLCIMKFILILPPLIAYTFFFTKQESQLLFIICDGSIIATDV